MKSLALGLTLAFSFTSLAQEWTQFRGPNGSGISHTPGIPAQWTPKDQAWTVKLPGEGHSSPVLWGNKLYITSADARQSQTHLQCLEAATGNELWRESVAFKAYRQHQFNQFAASTPAVDEKRVYVYQPGIDQSNLIAFDHAGNELWRHDLGATKSQHGGATSPIVYQDQVIIANDHLGDSFLLALDCASGDVNWKTRRRQATKTAYGIPCVYLPENEAPSLIFNSEQHGISAIDPQSGNLLWELDDLFKKRSVSSALFANGLLIGSCGSGGGGNYVVAIHPGNRSGKKPDLAYEIRRSAPYVPTSVAVNDLLFMISDAGVASCVEAKTGKVIWNERIGGNYFSSPIWIEGRLFCPSRDGEVVVLRADREFDILARNPLEENCHATPAVANDKLFVRTLKTLYAIQSRGKAS